MFAIFIHLLNHKIFGINATYQLFEHAFKLNTPRCFTYLLELAILNF